MNIAVYCGSQMGTKPCFEEAARDLGKWIAENGHTVVFGGTKYGLMGVVANAALEAGGKVIGITPKLEKLQERKHEGLTEFIVTEDMASRKSKMIEMSDAFVALPGGPGTLDEISEIICFERLGILDKPCVFVNSDGFYEYQKKAFKEMVDCGFSQEWDYRNVLFSDDIKEIGEFCTR